MSRTTHRKVKATSTRNSSNIHPRAVASHDNSMGGGPRSDFRHTDSARYSLIWIGAFVAFLLGILWLYLPTDGQDANQLEMLLVALVPNAIVVLVSAIAGALLFSWVQKSREEERVNRIAAHLASKVETLINTKLVDPEHSERKATLEHRLTERLDIVEREIHSFGPKHAHAQFFSNYSHSLKEEWFFDRRNGRYVGQIDIIVIYLDYWHSHLHKPLQEFIKQGGRLRVVMCDPHDDRALNAATDRFAQGSEDTTKAKIEEARSALVDIFTQCGAQDDQLELYYTRRIIWSCMIHYHGRGVIYSPFDHVRKQYRVDAPAFFTEVDVDSGEWALKEFKGLIEDKEMTRKA